MTGARRYGWQALAVAVLTVMTVFAVIGVGGSAAHAGPRTAAGSGPTRAASLSPSPSAIVVAGPPEAKAVAVLGDDAVNCARNSEPRLVVVSISRQHLWACQGARQVRSTPVTTGKVTDDDQTPLGSWRVQAKQRDRYLVGPGYRDYVHYWVPFNGDFGFHDATWQTMAFGSKGWRTQGSHGCVHLPMAQMQWLYGWATVTSTVVTIEA